MSDGFELNFRMGGRKNGKRAFQDSVLRAELLFGTHCHHLDADGQWCLNGSCDVGKPVTVPSEWTDAEG